MLAVGRQPLDRHDRGVRPVDRGLSSSHRPLTAWLRAARANPARAVPHLVEARDRDALPRSPGVNEASAADVDAAVPEAIEEDQVPRSELVTGHRRAVTVLLSRVVRKRDTDLGVHVLHEARAIEARWAGAPPVIRHAELADGEVDHPLSSRGGLVRPRARWWRAPNFDRRTAHRRRRHHSGTRRQGRGEPEEYREPHRSTTRSGARLEVDDSHARLTDQGGHASGTTQ